MKKKQKVKQIETPAQPVPVPDYEYTEEELAEFRDEHHAAMQDAWWAIYGPDLDFHWAEWQEAQREEEEERERAKHQK